MQEISDYYDGLVDGGMNSAAAHAALVAKLDSITIKRRLNFLIWLAILDLAVMLAILWRVL